MLKNFLLILIILLNISFPAFSATAPKNHKYYEKDYQNVWCKANGGVTEYILPDKARVDCVTSTHAIEFDFAKKWAESIGQALYYGYQLNKIPGIVLISEDGTKDEKYINRVKSIAKSHNIDLWVMTPSEMNLDYKTIVHSK